MIYTPPRSTVALKDDKALRRSKAEEREGDHALKKKVALLLLIFLLLPCSRPISAQEATAIQQIIVDLDARQLTLYKNGDIQASYTIAVGKSSTPSPIGEFKIIDKQVDWGSGFGSRWLRLNVPWGIYGIHGTNKPSAIGQAVSHGCIRLRNDNVETLYELVQYGTPVIIRGEDWRWHLPQPGTKAGDFGQSIVYLQQELTAHGFWAGHSDGYFGAMTAEAIKYYEALTFQEQTGTVSQRLLAKLSSTSVD